MSGLPGLVALLGLFARALTGIWGRLRQGVRQVEASGLLGFTIALAFCGSFFVAQHNLIYWLCLALPFVHLGLNDADRPRAKSSQATTSRRSVRA